ncbi:hypothetical protein CDAR_21411 [Caerostris darwini]|uniref:Uncharacterized protein n=1 Tax=Caerostris darwini TaxID=1538125 RepID=A0AAV4VYC0_9ARAC|nr:hypothetical protein CDAR_21411 [Caerostris darwini]
MGEGEKRRGDGGLTHTTSSQQEKRDIPPQVPLRRDSTSESVLCRGLSVLTLSVTYLVFSRPPLREMKQSLSLSSVSLSTSSHYRDASGCVWLELHLTHI